MCNQLQEICATMLTQNTTYILCTFMGFVVRYGEVNCYQKRSLLENEMYFCAFMFMLWTPTAEIRQIRVIKD